MNGHTLPNSTRSRRERGSALIWILLIAALCLVAFFIGRASMYKETPEQAVEAGLEASGEAIRKGAAEGAETVREGAAKLEESLENNR